MATDLDRAPGEADEDKDEFEDLAQRYYDDKFREMTTPENYSRTADNKSSSPDELNEAEQSGSEGAQSTGAASEAKMLAGATGAAGGGDLYNDSEELSFGKRGWLGRHRKKAVVGGIIGIMMGGGGILGMFYVAGPFQFIHIAQILQRAHLADQQDAGDQRMGGEIRYLRSCTKGVCDAGETRLGYLSSKMKTEILSQLEDLGLTPNYGKFTTYNGYTIDTTNENSPFKDMQPDEIKQALLDKGIPESSISFDGNKVTVTPDSSYTSKKLTLRALVGLMNESKIPDALRWRILAKYGAVTWHPLKRLDASANARAYDLWEKAREKWLKTGQESPIIDTADAKQTQTNPETGKPETVNASDGSTTTSSYDKVKGVLDDIQASHGTALKVGGGIATAVGTLCLLKAVNDNVGTVRFAENIMPVMRMGSEAVTVGNQVMNGNDVDTNELGILSRQFNDQSDGSNWSAAQTFQADVGEPTNGQDVDQQTRDIFTPGNKSPGWLSWIDHVPGLGGLCSTAGGIIVGIGSAVVGIFSGSAASFVIGGVAGLALGPTVIKQASHFLAGDAVDVLAGGAKWGNLVNYGTRFFANSGARQDAGILLSGAQVAALNNVQNTESQAQFDSKSIAYRLFNPTDYRSLLSKVIDSQSTQPGQEVSHVASMFMNFGHYLAALPTMLLSPLAHAQTANAYPYPFPQYGFSLDDLSNPAVQDPYANADAAARTLDIPCLIFVNGKWVPNHPCGEDYRREVALCFNDSITKIADPDGVSRWDVIPGASNSDSALNLYDPTIYDANNCQTAPKFTADGQEYQLSAESWLQMRFFIFDTSVMEGYACQHGDTLSCSNDGISS